MFKLEFSTDGASFKDVYTGEYDDFSERHEIIWTLRNIERQLDNGAKRGSVIDMNGNKIGEWSR